MKEDIGDADTATTTQKLSLQQRRNILNRKLNAWEAIQTIYMPGVACLHHNHQQRRKTDAAESEVEQAEDRLMFFPSEVLRTSPGNVVESSNLTFIEARLREGQAHNSLQELRHYLRLLAHLHRDRNVNSRGQRECTRSITLIKRAEAKKNGAAETYRRAWSALSTLDPDGAWSDSLRRLLYCDIRGLTEADPMLPSHEQTQGRYKTSWIWSATGICTRRESGDTELNECKETYHRRSYELIHGIRSSCGMVSRSRSPYEMEGRDLARTSGDEAGSSVADMEGRMVDKTRLGAG